MPLIASAALMNHAHEVSFYIGTYTSPSGSQGIYKAELDLDTGSVSVPKLAAKTPNPSYVALGPHGKHLYAVDESDHGHLSAFAVEPSGTLRLLNTQAVGGGAPCYVSLDAQGRYAFTASYIGGVVQTLQVLDDGSLAAPGSTIVNNGSGPDKGRQDASHMHWVHVDPSGRFVYTCDLGTDAIQQYTYVPDTGLINEEVWYKPASTVPAGAGPRHAVWSPGGHFMYVNNEMGNSVSVFEVFGDGRPRLRQTISTLLAGGHSVGSAEIACHPNGKWIYVSNRGDDSIAVFAIGKDGMLTQIQVATAGVKVPRGFGIDPSGAWLVVGGQSSNDVTSLRIDAATGKLSAPGNRLSLGSPVCIVFVGPAA